jgi:hypothetical protein
VTLDGGDAGSSGAGSSLDKFAAGDPFTPPARIASSETATATATLSSSDGGKSGGADGGSGGDSPSTTEPDVPNQVQPPQTETQTSEFEYVADVTFWTGERRRTLRGLRKLDMLPNQSAPVLIFMGTAGKGGNAVFLVDSTLKTAGEGRCVPTGANCAYVHIGAGAEHTFSTEEGDSYRLRVDEIRRVAVDAAASKSSRPVAQGSGGAVRRFELPSLIDLVAVAETTTTQPADNPGKRSSVATGGR